MSRLPNPAGMRAAFASYAEAQAARIMPGVSIIKVGSLTYERDAAGTALTTQGGETWSPRGTAKLAHWGIAGVAHGSRPGGATGYMAAPTVDEGARMQQAFDWAVARGAVLRGDRRRVYGTTIPLVFGARNGGVALNGSHLEDVNIRAMAGTWAAGTRVGTDPNAWTFGAAVLTIGKAASAGGAGKPQVSARHVRVDAARIAPVSVHYMGAAQVPQEHVTGERGTECNFLVGWGGDNTPAPVDLDGWSCTAATFFACEGRSFLFGEQSNGGFGTNDGSGWYGLIGRTAFDLVVRGSDQTFDSCVFSTGLNALILCKSFSNKFTGCKFWNGIATETASVTAIITPGASGYEFDACTFQDGRVQIGAFVGKWVGNKFEKFVHQQLRLVASDPGETAAQLVFVGNFADEDAPVMDTAGSGTWGSFAGTWIGNQRNTGVPLPVQTKLLVHGGFEIENSGRIKLPALHFTPVAATPGLAAQVLVAADGNLYFHTGTGWRVVTSTAVV